MYVVSGLTTTRTLSIMVCKGAAVTVDKLEGDKSVGDEVEEDLDAVLRSAGTELEDLTVAFADGRPVSHALCDSSGMVRQVKLDTIVDLTDET